MLDVNDNAPRFRPFGVTNFTEKILEGAQPGTTLLSVSAVDPDKGPNGQVTYQLLHLPRGGYVRLEDPSVGGLLLAACCDQTQHAPVFNLLSFKKQQTVAYNPIWHVVENVGKNTECSDLQIINLYFIHNIRL